MDLYIGTVDSKERKREQGISTDWHETNKEGETFEKIEGNANVEALA